MKSQTLAVSIVLLLITVAALPGLSFSLSSSLTSQNNGISYDTGGIIIPPNSKYNVFKIDDGTFGDDEAYEIATSSGSFGTGEVLLTIPEGKTFKICIKIDSRFSSYFNSFDLAIDYKGDEKPDISATQLDGGRLDSVGGIKTGYLYSTTSGECYLIPDAGTATEITSSSKDITMDIIGRESRVDIHFYIIFIQLI